ncbi:MAG: hypothetical protein KDM63_04385 [Verrucomicrobiae bacterium]|nr:hypothetical protein [Verrucomicrobiae bacterium]MCB1086259.1 hypothetical protein [Verrucomicrobiae bacterium]MCB1092465.1 hypothetical protein [Verrucomicrobiae bacterium]
MRKKRFAARSRAVCQDVHFVEVEFPAPIRPRLVVTFSDGLHLVLEDERAARVAAEFIAAYRAAEWKGGRR